MTFAKGLKRFGWWEKFKEDKFEDIHNFLRHMALYVGLIAYTAVGGFVSIEFRMISIQSKISYIHISSWYIIPFLVLFDIRASFRKSVPSRASGSSFLRKVEFEEHDLQSNFQLDR